MRHRLDQRLHDPGSGRQVEEPPVVEAVDDHDAAPTGADRGLITTVPHWSSAAGEPADQGGVVEHGVGTTGTASASSAR